MGELYQTGREMTHPYTSGMRFGEYSQEELTAMSTSLTEEERRSPFAFHYDEPMAPLTAAQEAALAAGPLPPDACYMPRQLGPLLLNPESHSARNGYGVLPNGVGYAAIHIVQDGITDMMIRKYREEFARNGPRTLFYKIWFPGAHLLHYENGVAENFGWGMLNLEMDAEPFCLSHLGLTAQEIMARDPDGICLLGLCGRGWPLAGPEEDGMYASMVQYTRQTPRGRELLVRYWNGILFRPDGSLAYRIDPDRERTQVHMRLMMEHCMREYQNELRLMKAFWNNGI